MCSEILLLASTFSETPKRKFDNNTYCDMLSTITTKLGKDVDTSTNEINNDTLAKFAASIFDRSKQSKSDHSDCIDHIVHY